MDFGEKAFELMEFGVMAFGLMEFVEKGIRGNSRQWVYWGRISRAYIHTNIKICVDLGLKADSPAYPYV